MTSTSQSARRPRKLIFYTYALAGGGAERVWAQLATGFARLGDDVAMMVDFEARENLPYLDARVRLTTLGTSHVGAVRALARHIARDKPDAVLAALAVSNIKAAAAATIAGARRRTILSYHGFAESEPQRLSRISYRSTPALTRLTGATIAVSDSLRHHLIEDWRADPKRTHRIYNPVDCGIVLAPTAAELAERTPEILAVGRLEKRKNFDLVLRAFAALGRPDVGLTLLGDGPERNALIALADQLGIGDRLRMPGHVAEPWLYYARATCLAVASASEAFGLTVAEALAHGLPVVSSDCNGPREILADGRFGLLVPIGDVPALTAALAQALAQPGDPAPRIARGLEFSLDAAVAAYGAVIDGLRG
jgi:glycosyltransferase involved in cell wall biosynthesis